PDTENHYLEPDISCIMTKGKAFLSNSDYEDGSYGEPTGYMDMASRDIVQLLAALERNFGVDYTTSTHIESFYKYPLYAMYNSGLIQSYGDGGRSYSGFTDLHAQWLVHRTGNPFLYNYLKLFWETDVRSEERRVGRA